MRKPNLHLYVFESATLGRAIVMRHLSRRLGITPEDGGAFLNSYGDLVVAMWRDFGRQLSAYASRPDIEEAVIRAAVDTLFCPDQWMAGGPIAVAQVGRAEDSLAGKKTPPSQRQSILRLL